MNIVQNILNKTDLDERLQDALSRGFQSFKSNTANLAHTARENVSNLLGQYQAQAKFPKIDTSGVAQGFSNFINPQPVQPPQGLMQKFQSFISDAPKLATQFQFGLNQDFNKKALGMAKDVFIEAPARAGGSMGLSLTGNQQITPTTSSEKFLLGDDPVKSLGLRSKELENWQTNHGLPGASVTSPLMIAGLTFADAFPMVGGSEKKVIGEVGDDLLKMGQQMLSKLPKEERMSWLLHYGDELIKAGWPQKVIDKMSAPRAYAALKTGMEPADVLFKQKIGKEIIPGLEGAKDAFWDWIYKRRAAPISGQIAANEFKDLDNLGLEGIFRFQSGDVTGKFADVKNFFDSWYKNLKDQGINMNFKRDYLPQLWANTSGEIEKVFGKNLGLKASFQLESVLKNYAEGIENGLTPRFSKISDLVKWYEGRSLKLEADKGFFDYLRGQKFIRPTVKAPTDWQILSAEHFPRFAVKSEGVKYSGTYSAPADLAKEINGYLTDPTGPVASFAKLATRAKNLALSAGIPGTSVNFHGSVNLLRRDLLSANNPIKNFVRDVRWMWDVNSAKQFVDSNLKDAEFFVRHGMTLSSEDWKLFTPEVPKGLEKVESWFGKLFGDPTFEKFLPALKISFAQDQYKFLTQHLDETSAAKKAAETANSLFGGIEFQKLGVSKEWQNVLRILFLAPDWLATNGLVGKNAVTSLLHPASPENKLWMTFNRNFVLFKLTENLTNKALSGHFMHENEAGHKWEIDSGQYDPQTGKKIFWRTPGTAEDFGRLPYETVMAIADGKWEALPRLWTNRMSMPLAAVGHLAFNTDYRGRPLYGSQAGTPLQQLIKTGNEVASFFGVPSQIRTSIDLAAGNISPLEAGSQYVESPARFQVAPGASTKAGKSTIDLLQQAGLQGQQLWDTMSDKYKKENTTKINSQPSLIERLRSFFDGQPVISKPQTDTLINLLSKEKDVDEKAKKIKEIFETGLDRDSIEILLQKNNLPGYEEASLTMAKSLTLDNRSDYLKSLMTGLQGDSYKAKLVQLSDADLLTTSVTTRWVETGDITSTQKKSIDNFIKLSKGLSAPAKLKLLPIKQLRRLPKPKSSFLKPLKLKAVPNFKPLTPVKPLKVSLIKSYTRGGVKKK